nr:peptidoglycan recognition protein 1 [Pelodiscus sinensis]|eukprot:XP_025043188.1 peptidoglycan recognition protein 1 [Pelodiscus sinensis]
MDRNRWSDIGYNFLVGEDGRVYEGRGWTTRGAHAPSMNKISLGVSFMGSYTSTWVPSRGDSNLNFLQILNSPQHAAGMNAAQRLIRCAVSRGFLSHSYTLKGHRNVNPTSCPGDALYRRERQGFIPVPATSPGRRGDQGESHWGLLCPAETAPNAAALNAAQRLIRCAVSRGFLSHSYTLKGHRNVNPTSCPGDALYRVITKWPRTQREDDAAADAGRVALRALRHGACQWGARAPRSRVRLRTPAPFVIIHHTAGNHCTSQAACSQQVKSIWSDIGYKGEGPWLRKCSRGVALQNAMEGTETDVANRERGRGKGIYRGHVTSPGCRRDQGEIHWGLLCPAETAPNAAALNAARSLIQCAVSRGYLSRSYTLKGHRNVNPTSCPGNALYGVIPSDEVYGTY